MAAFNLFGQVRQERDYNKSFAVSKNSRVEIVSKYGEIIIHTWDLDSVKFDVVVRAEGKNSDAVRKSMGKVDIRFREVGQMVSAVTEVTSGSGVLGRLSSQLEGVVGNNKLQVNYQVWIPQNVQLKIENKYGDVYLSDLDNKVDIEVSHGDIKGGDLMNDLTLTHSYGKASFRTINSSLVTLRGSELEVEEANAMNFESGSSEIRIDKIDKVQFNSRNDEIRLLAVNQLVCEGSFTDVTVDNLKTSAEFDFSYGDIYLSNINQDFKSIDIKGKSTDINLILNQASFIKTYIKGAEDKMLLPNSMLTMTKEQIEHENLISLSGDVGPPNSNHSDLRIEATGGEVVVSIKETPLFSDRD